ncbi:MAG: bifunctional riboflavin kinase/FAD synthetase [Micrococcaceae bacterium]
MHYWQGLTAVPTPQPASVVTLGNFDGVHRGHQAVLDQVVATARSRGEQAVALTFDPHPRLVHRPEEPLVPIVSLPQRLELLADRDLDAAVVVHYTLDFAQQSPEEFVRTALVETLNASVVIVGHDVRFGLQNSGDFTAMCELGAAHGFEVIAIDDVGEQRRWSSTWVRESLTAGRVAAAAQVLGRHHAVQGEVVHGHARGRELGFPTANLSTEAQGLIPADGVYAGWLIDQTERRWPAAISVGSNPTFDDIERVVEAHVMDRPDEEIADFDLYGQQVTVEFVARLRGMVAFEGIEKLIEQMDRDVSAARAILRGEQPAEDSDSATRP